MLNRLGVIGVFLASPALLGADGCAAQTSGPGGPSAGPATPASDGRYDRLRIEGDKSVNGIADVSVEYDDDGVGWLVYSAIKIPAKIETRIAKSTNRGRSWTYVATINSDSEETVTIGGKEYKGMWRHETPALVYDPGDRKAKWKLYWHKYFAKKPYKRVQTRMQTDGWIAYRSAQSPEGPWSEEVRLFGIESTGSKIDPSKLHKDLKRVKFVTEPGVIVEDGVLYMSLDTNTTKTGFGQWRRRKVILLASSDHGENWDYVGPLTEFKDAKELGYTVLTGSALVREKGRLFLLVAPAGSRSSKQKGHDGTLVLEFADISKGKLVRRGKDLAPIKHIRLTREAGGVSDYHEENVNGGLLMPQVDPKALPEVFQAYSTNESLLR